MESQSERDVQARVCRLDDQFHDDRGPLPRWETTSPSLLSMLWAEAVYYYNQGEQYWLSKELEAYANEQTNERFEEDPWVEVVQRKLREFTEISLRQACNESFENINDKDITKEMIRRMSHCLQMAGWRKDGRFNSGPQRNQARFVKEAEKAFEGDNEQTTYSF